jgi:hypothetical protein
MTCGQQNVSEEIVDCGGVIKMMKISSIIKAYLWAEISKLGAGQQGSKVDMGIVEGYINISLLFCCSLRFLILLS